MSKKVYAIVFITITISIAVFMNTKEIPNNKEKNQVAKSAPVGSSGVRILFNLPQFNLINQNGKSFGGSDLKGHLWIANFIFTRCPTICPKMTRQMRILQDQLKNDPLWKNIRLISFSVDPDYDKAIVLKRYAKNFSAIESNWFFLTGDRNTIWKLSKKGFRLAVGESPPKAEMPIFHSPNFVLVDRKMQIRGYYDGFEEKTRKQLIKDLHKVAKESK